MNAVQVQADVRSIQRNRFSDRISKPAHRKNIRMMNAGFREGLLMQT